MVKKVIPDGPIAVDASFLVGIATHQRSAARFVGLLSRSIITCVNFGETLYKLRDISGTNPTATENLFRNLGVRIEAVDVEVARHFPRLKDLDLRHRKSRAATATAAAGSRSKSLSVADIICLGFSRERQLPLLTGDKLWLEYDPLELGVLVFDFRDPTLTV